jgi:hypothetical protein
LLEVELIQCKYIFIAFIDKDYMASQYLSDGDIVELMELIRESISLSLLDEIEKTGARASFFGQYLQARKGSQRSRPMPFVIAQTPDQLRLLESGKLEGRVYELGIEAQIKGEISTNSVHFTKKYLPETDILGPGEQHEINYNGKGDKGVNYRGRWSFEDRGGDMQNSGTFDLHKIRDIAFLRKELERTAREE